MMSRQTPSLVLLGLALCLVGACAPRQPADAPESGLSVETTPSPGIVRLEEEELKAVGTLVYVRESQTFALVNSGPDGRLTGKEPLIATIGEGSDRNQDLVGLIGGYLELHGTAAESTNTALPEISIESIRIIWLPSER